MTIDDKILDRLHSTWVHKDNIWPNTLSTSYIHNTSTPNQSTINWNETVSAEDLDLILPVDCCFHQADMDGDNSISDSSQEENLKSQNLLTTEIVVAIKVNGTERLFRCLLDTGTSRSLATAKAVKQANMIEKKNKKIC